MNNNKPTALLLTAPGCPHCAGMKQALQHLLDEGLLAGLEVVDISQQPRRAEDYGVRGVPWCELGRFELAGAHSEGELRQWAGYAAQPDGMFHYLSEMLGGGQLATAERVLRRHPDALPVLLELMQDDAQSINVQIGIGALFESLQGEPILHGLVPALGELSRHATARVRSDACHYLGLSADPGAVDYLQAALQDEDADTREIAAEALTLVNEVMHG